MKLIKTVIVEDQNIFRLGLKAVLESSNKIEVCGETGYGKEALSVIKNTDPDVVIVDIGLPDISGIQVVEEIVQVYSNKIKTIITTGSCDKKLVKEVFKKGATSFYSKNNAESKIIEAVITTFKGESWIDSKIHTIVAQAMWEINAKNTPGSTVTKREYEVLKLLAKGLTYEEMANKLCLEISTVRSHAHRIIGKLDKPGEDKKHRPTRGKAVCEALRLGILCSEDLTEEIYKQTKEFTPDYNKREFLAA
ncbi:response regulator transcription factor [Nostoc sp. 'Peltigera membranacea cyanobiont' 232]|uniref:response regulator transcription factor n=1 Tax=Nostoc sp. 'Peltigera membranacea cyanobiont' 232 TaxID=2014531 RepID=UPI000B95C4C9|nr:response regulator transcription factor [Nostoc sp. 'Peltigera membranacea cyanobiont' 232]OYE02669.1 DNA-binding response regulator [Nostoc sp. 'Peltigera membranacea cyanobiont' 232]